MTKRTLGIILGLWVAVLPFLGFPTDWKKGIIVVSGVVLAILSYLNVKKTNII